MRLIKTSEIAEILKVPLPKIQRHLRDSNILPTLIKGNAYWWAPEVVDQVRELVKATRTYTRKQTIRPTLCESRRALMSDKT